MHETHHDKHQRVLCLVCPIDAKNLPLTLASHIVSYLSMKEFLRMLRVSRFMNIVTRMQSSLPHVVDTRDWKTNVEASDRLPQSFFSMSPVTLFIGGTLGEDDISRLCGRNHRDGSLSPVKHAPHGNRTTTIHIEMGDVAMQWNMKTNNAIDAICKTYPHIQRLYIQDACSYEQLFIDGVSSCQHLTHLEVCNIVGINDLHLPPTLCSLRICIYQNVDIKNLVSLLSNLEVLHLKNTIDYMTMTELLQLPRLKTLRCRCITLSSNKHDIISFSSSSITSFTCDSVLQNTNRIGTIGQDILSRLPALEHCSIGSMEESMLGFDLCHGQSSIKSIALQFNRMNDVNDIDKSIVYMCRYMTKLTHFTCMYSPIHFYNEFLVSPFQPLSHLKHLSHITMVDTNSSWLWLPPGLPSLQHLTLVRYSDSTDTRDVMADYMMQHYPNVTIVRTLFTTFQ